MDVTQRLSLAVALTALTSYVVKLGVHTVSEGHVGVYWRAGKLLPDYGEAGVNFMVPFVDRMEEVQITLQTDRVNNIPCGTSGGVIIDFSSIEVVNRLSKEHAIDIIRNFGVDYDKVWIFDKIHHEINQFCSGHTLQEVYIDLFSTLDESLATALQADIDRFAPGLSIISVRVTKPRIPNSIAADYAAMESEKTKLLVAVQAAKTERQLAETEKMRAEINAQKNASVSAIEQERIVKEKEAEQRINKIEDETFLHRERAHADADFYHKQRQAEANKLLYTPEFLQYTYAHSLSQNTKIYFGEKLPSVWMGDLVRGDH